MTRPPITVLIPVLGRPAQTQHVVSTIKATSDALVWLLTSPGDLVPRIPEADRIWQMEFEQGSGDYARKLNHAAREVETEWFFQGATDLCFHPGWAEFALAAGAAPEYPCAGCNGMRSALCSDCEGAAANPVVVVGTNDLCNPVVMRGLHSTHSLIRTAYVRDVGTTFGDGPGIAFHEGYDHQYIDNELKEVTHWRGLWTFALQSKVEHLHPLCGKSERDWVYDKALSRGVADGRLYAMRRRMWIRAGRP